MYRYFFGAAGAVYPCGRGHLYISHGNKRLHLSSTSTAATTPSYKEETLALSIINNNYVSASKGEYIICYQSPDSGYYFYLSGSASYNPIFKSLGASNKNYINTGLRLYKKVQHPAALPSMATATLQVRHRRTSRGT